MSNRIQFRRDTAARWAECNPILQEGELGLETDTRHSKIGDGIHTWNELEYSIVTHNITSQPGTSESLVISQKGVTDLIKSDWVGTQSEYDNLTNRDNERWYIVINNDSEVEALYRGDRLTYFNITDGSGKIKLTYIPNTFAEFYGRYTGGDDKDEFISELPEPSYGQILSGGSVYYHLGVNRFIKFYSLNGFQVTLKYYLLTKWDGCEEYGIPDDDGVKPIFNKIYLDVLNSNGENRWNGETLVKIGISKEDTLQIGNSIYDAFSGYEGLKLKDEVAKLKNDVQKLKDLNDLYGNEYNLSRGWANDAYSSLEEALEYVGNDLFFDDLLDNVRIRFLLLENNVSKWVVYEFWSGPYNTWDYTSTDCWREISKYI